MVAMLHCRDAGGSFRHTRGKFQIWERTKKKLGEGGFLKKKQKRNTKTKLIQIFQKPQYGSNCLYLFEKHFQGIKCLFLFSDVSADIKL